MKTDRFLARLRENLRLVMAAKSLTQTEVADLLDVSQSYISQILSAKQLLPPSQGFLERFASMTGVSIDALTNADLSRKTERLLVRESLPDGGLTFSSYLGTSEELVPKILDLYLAPGSKVADPWHGRGIFWRKVPKGKYDLHLTDLEADEIDARFLPYDDSAFDGVICDPPWLTASPTGMSHWNADRYRTRGNHEQNGKRITFSDLLELYRESAQEAARVLRPDGFLIAKMQDMVATGGFRSHFEIVQKELKEGFVVEDCFVLTQVGPPALSHGEQVHSRRNHSYFYVLRRKGGKRVWRGIGR